MKKVFLIVLVVLAVLVSVGIVANDGDVFAVFDRAVSYVSDRTVIFTDFISDVFGADFYILVSKRPDIDLYLQLVVDGIEQDYLQGKIDSRTRHNYRQSLNSFKYKFDADIPLSSISLQIPFTLDESPLNLYLSADQLSELSHILQFKYHVFAVYP